MKQVDNAQVMNLGRISLILLKREKSCKLGIKSKRSKAAYDQNYLLTLLDFKATDDTESI